MRVSAGLLVTLAAAVILSGCASASRTSTPRATGWGAPVTKGYKPASQVAPHAQAMVQGRETLAECMQRPESKADGGMGCMNAIEDMPVN